MGGGGGELHNKELHDFYFFPDLIMVIKQRRMERAGHVARKGKKKLKTVGLKRLK